jgi:hypothetical protein
VLTQQSTISGANLNFEVGKAYVLTFDVTASAGFITQVEIGGTNDTTDITSSGTYTEVITASSTNDRLGFTANIDFVGTIDNVTVTDGDADRSVNANGLIVNGTVTRTAVWLLALIWWPTLASLPATTLSSRITVTSTSGRVTSR